MKKCRVSVIMPAYNVELYIQDAIESILNQTFKDFEFIIINDGSTDNTAKIIQKYAKKDKRIKFINHSVNKGFIARLNECLDIAKGEYIAKMDSDDISLPERLYKQVEFLDNHLDYGMVGCALRVFGDKSYVLKNPQEVRIADFMSGCKTTIFMLRADIIEKNNLRFDKNYFAVEDLEFYSRFARFSKIYNLQEVLYLYRKHSSSCSVKHRLIQDENTKRVKYDIANFLFGDKKTADNFYAIYSWVYVFFIPFIKIKKYNFKRNKYYLFGIIPLILIDDFKVYLFGAIKIGNIK